MSCTSAVTLLMLLHGIAHASAGMWAIGSGPTWLTTTCWTMAALGYAGAALGRWGLPGLQGRWRVLVAIATLSSLSLMLFVGGWLGFTGILMDAGVLALAHWAVPNVHKGPARRTTKQLVLASLAALGTAYLVTVPALRPLYLTWGTTPAEREMPLFGDDLAPLARYRLDHAITIYAPADSIWPWLVQVGQDRGGFYSYDQLERLVGDHVHNADRIHPEWQTLRTGDLVRAVQPDYLGGMFGDSVGWRVVAIDPQRAMVLDKWGAFVLVPLDTATTRLVIRTRGSGTPGLASFLLAPLNVYVFEPMHFVMQREMLRGIKRRAEGQGVERAS